jgi:hypothetical protein
MRRTLIGSIAFAMGALLLLATPASAKGISSARFTGPGLPPGGITIRGGPEDGPTNGMLFQSGAFGSKTTGPWGFGLDRSDLGVPYRMVITPDWDSRAHAVVVVYPYAKGGPWTYTPPGQNLVPAGEALTGGWWQVGHRMIGSFSERIARQFRALLVRNGFPSEAPTYTAPAKPLPGQPVETAPAAKSTTEAGPVQVGTSGAWPVWAWILIAVGMGGALFLVASRQRRRVTA